MAISEIFDSNSVPGTILKDIEIFLQYIHDNELDITGKKGLLPNHCLPKLNTAISHPLKLDLKRQQQMSYPHISALYLLSRSLGFIQFIQRGSKRFLTINTGLISEWNKLNTVEKYFSLMQAWFFRCDERLINKKRSYWYGGIFGSVSRFLMDDLKIDKVLTNQKERRDQLYCINLYNLALLEMFGLINVKDDNTQLEKSWPVCNISISEFGQKWIELLKRSNYKKLFLLIDDDKLQGSKKFYKNISPFFPKWKKSFEPKRKNTDDRLHTFKVSLSKKVWRRINILGTDSLDDLADFILDAFSFDNDHLYRFTYTDRFGSLNSINDYRCEEPPSSDEVYVGDIDIMIGDSIEFLFDFGDSWLFDIQLESITTKSDCQDKPEVIKSFGEAPEQYQW